MKKQILESKNHPVAVVCQIFRQEFGKAYSKYVTTQGKNDGLALYKLVKEKSKMLQENFARKQEESRNLEGLSDDDCDEDDEQDINLTNQLIGEAQAFILIIRWLIYEFYQFKILKMERLLVGQDFDALEDDMLFIIHKITISKDVFKSLLVLTRIANKGDDKELRDKFKQIGELNSKYFPLENKPKNPFNKSEEDT